MRAPTVLSAVLLLAFLTHAEPLRESADELLVQEQPEAQDQDTAIYFLGDERATREASDVQVKGMCLCREGICSLGEYQVGTCVRNGLRYSYCCR